MKIRIYGTSKPSVLVIHGGPGAAGSMAAVARRLSDLWRVIEPFQRADSATVAEHMADLHEVIESKCGGERPALVGHSWGAMLVLAYAAAHPNLVGQLVLIGCGTFDTAARAQLRATMEAKRDDALRHRFDHLAEEFPDPNERHRALESLTLPLYSYDLVSTDQEIEPPEPGGRDDETWQDMVRLQQEGVYPAAFAAIKAPVLMIHGEVDPHPGPMIHASLIPHLPQLEYRELKRCGHYPWLEKAARDEFFSVLRNWLSRRTTYVMNRSKHESG